MLFHAKAQIMPTPQNEHFKEKEIIVCSLVQNNIIEDTA